MIKNTAKQAIRIAKIIYTPLSLLFILYFIVVNRELLYKMTLAADLYFLAGAIIFWSFMHLSSCVITKIILKGLNKQITYSLLLHFYILRLPARYLPGGVWHTVGRFSDYHKNGTSKTQLTLLAVTETTLAGLITFLIGGGYIFYTEPSSRIAPLTGGFALISIVALLFTPIVLSIFQKRFNLGEDWFYNYLVLILVAIFHWAIAATSFVLYYYSLTPTHPNLTLTFYTAASYLFSWGVGYVSIFAPQGVGVFELVAGKLLILPIGLGGAIAFIAGFRVVTLAADCLTWGGYNIYKSLLTKKFPLLKS